MTMFKKSSQMPNRENILTKKTKANIVLGIDPGYDRLGIAIVKKEGSQKEQLIYSTCFETDRKEEIYERFAKIGDYISSLMKKYKPDQVAIESLFIAKNQKTAMRVAETRGIIIYEAVKRMIPVFEYTPLQIKSAITGDGTSDKTRIIKMIHLLINMGKTKTVDDEYDAVAVALTHFARKKFQ